MTVRRRSRSSAPRVRSPSSRYPSTSMNPLDEAELNTIKEWNRQLITLATGAVVLAGTFLKDLLTGQVGDTTSKHLFILSEVSWAAAAICGMLLYQYLITKISLHCTARIRIRFAKDTMIRLTAGLEILLFSLGLGTFIVFAFMNFPISTAVEVTEIQPIVLEPLSLNFNGSIEASINLQGIERTDSISPCYFTVPDLNIEMGGNQSDGWFVSGMASSDAGGIRTIEFSNLVNVSDDPPPRLLGLDPTQFVGGKRGDIYTFHLLQPLKEVRFRADALLNQRVFGFTIMAVDECGNLVVIDPEIIQ
jgi:hypothetical protein